MLLVTAIVFALAWTQANAWAEEILVSAAASLTDVLNDISKGYQSKSKNTVRFNYGPSSEQCNSGFYADVQPPGKACGGFDQAAFEPLGATRRTISFNFHPPLSTA